MGYTDDYAARTKPAPHAAAYIYANLQDDFPKVPKLESALKDVCESLYTHCTGPVGAVSVKLEKNDSAKSPYGFWVEINTAGHRDASLAAAQDFQQLMGLGFKHGHVGPMDESHPSMLRMYFSHNSLQNLATAVNTSIGVEMTREVQPFEKGGAVERVGDRTPGKGLITLDSAMMRPDLPPHG